MPRYCILTPDPSYYEDWSRDADHLTRLLGEDLAFHPWTTPDLPVADIILPLLAWGYQRDPARWFAALEDWDAAGLCLWNPAAMLRWNSDKSYLLDLAARDVAIVPSLYRSALRATDLEDAAQAFGTRKLVIKPSISGGADGTYLIGPRDPLPADVMGRAMLIQPMMAAIATEGEWSLFLFDGQLSHAILKRPAAGDFRVQEQFGGREDSCAAPPEAIALAMAALAACETMPLYARVDMVRGADGQFCLMELELIEPSLFFAHAADGGAMFRAALSARTV